MNKLVLFLVPSLFASTAFAQTAAITYHKENKLDKAKEEIDKAVGDAKLATKAKTWYYRGQIYESIANDATKLFSKLDSNAATVAYESYKKATELDKPGGSFDKDSRSAMTGQSMYAAIFNQALARYQAGNYPEAVKNFQLAQEVSPKDTLAALYTGIASQQGNDLATARVGYEKYIALGGKEADVYGSLISMYRNEQNFDKALELTKQGIAANPNNKALKDEELNLYLASGKADQATENLRQAIERDPKNPQYHLNLGIMNDNAGSKLLETADAAESEAKKLESSGKKAEGAAKREEAKKLRTDAQAKKQEGLVSYQKVMELDPNNFDANYNLGVFYFNQGAESIKKRNAMDLKQYQKDGKKADAEIQGQFEQVLPYFEKAHQINPKDESVLENLRKVYSQLKRTADADRITKLIEAAPKK
ncbi:MAG: tetratricopeptide repeat protein [Ferruginibacter sp.]|nr:tetratricopeptide repeat protein [Cytophagales bacterium]